MYRHRSSLMYNDSIRSALTGTTSLCKTVVLLSNAKVGGIVTGCEGRNIW